MDSQTSIGPVRARAWASLVAVVLTVAPSGGQAVNKGLTDVVGLKVGHFTRSERPTGWTVVLAPAGAVGAVDVRGGAQATRETDLLDPVNTVDHVHAIVLSGGSAFGLVSATGVMRFLEERQGGFEQPPGEGRQG